MFLEEQRVPGLANAMQTILTELNNTHSNPTLKWGTFISIGPPLPLLLYLALQLSLCHETSLRFKNGITKAEESNSVP